jgi:hypothetical protein
MPSATLLQAVDRLDQAITTIEARVAALADSAPPADERRQTAVRTAIAELDQLIAGLSRHKPRAEQQDGNVIDG